MNSLRNNQPQNRRIGVLSLFVFLLQAIVPIGYMPASMAGDGAWIKLCPSAFSNVVITSVQGGKHRHGNENLLPIADRHIAQDGHMRVDLHRSASPVDQLLLNGQTASHDGHHSWQKQCPFGSVSTNDCAPSIAQMVATIASYRAFDLQPLPNNPYHVTRLRAHFQRAPPTLL